MIVYKRKKTPIRCICNKRLFDNKSIEEGIIEVRCDRCLRYLEIDLGTYKSEADRDKSVREIKVNKGIRYRRIRRFR